MMVMKKRTTAIAEPTWSWVTIPSHISAISSSGREVISSDPGFAVDRNRDAHGGFFRVHERNEPMQGTESGCYRHWRVVGVRLWPIILPRDADVTQTG